MNLSTILKIGVPILIALLGWGTWDGFNQGAKVKQLTADRASCASAALAADEPLTTCPAEVAGRIVAARRAKECETALAKGDLYAIRGTCGEQVKRVAADRDSARGDLATTQQQLATAGAETDAAVARAEARATLKADRKTQNDRTIQAAPRAADGRVHCDADCLRKLAGTP